MPRAKLTESERANRLLLGEISKGRELLAETPRESCEAVGMKYNTVRSLRKQDPGTYRLDELRRLAKHYGWTDRTVAQILCVPYHGSTLE